MDRCITLTTLIAVCCLGNCCHGQQTDQRDANLRDANLGVRDASERDTNQRDASRPNAKVQEAASVLDTPHDQDAVTRAVQSTADCQAGDLLAARQSFTNDRTPPFDFDQVTVFHQPLIQVKMRVAQVVRDDSLQAGSVLDYVSRRGPESLIDGYNVNQNRQRTSAVTRFPGPTSLLGVVEDASGDYGLNSGNGALVNLTALRLNYIARLLATEFQADLLTCPQVVTLNGQRVSFTSGDKVPFRLGQTVLHDGTAAIQEFFYKHVGTHVEVTPRIINWGAYGEGRGRAPVVAADVRDWNQLTKLILRERLHPGELPEETAALYRHYSRQNVLVKSDDQRLLLDWINELSLADLAQLLATRRAHDRNYEFQFEEIFYPLGQVPLDERGLPRRACDWRPEDCTVDVELTLRQSTGGDVSPAVRAAAPSENRPSLVANEEEIGAAVATVVQLKSGHGALIAGLIGERDVEEVAKVPVLGDLPLAGHLFRSKSVNRQKTETLIFLEVEVLRHDPHLQRAQSAADYSLGRAYVDGEVLDHPLHAGLRRAGFGSYLPPRSAAEKIYWQRLGVKIRRGTTAIDDILE